MGKRLLLVLCATGLSFLLLEGAFSLLQNQSLIPRSERAAPRTFRTDEERLALANLAEGGYRVHQDPLVTNCLRPGENQSTLNARFSADDLGLRQRPGPPPPDSALRVVVLGDSVAFGLGLNDEQTIAAHLEQLLQDVRGPEAPAVACFTVAAPGWNHRNAIHYLFNYFQEIDPDIVLYLPISNDLANTFHVTEAGHRRLGLDAASDDPWLSVHLESWFALRQRFVRMKREGVLERLPTGGAEGPLVLNADLSRESRLRYDANAASIARLAMLLERQDRKLMLLHYREEPVFSDYVWILRARLMELGLDIPEIPIFIQPPGELVLAEDPHPNSRGAWTIARWIAEELLRRGWVSPGAGHTLPQVDSVAVTNRAPPRTREEITKKVAEVREAARESLRDRIDLKTAQGINQIYGGINPDGSISTRLLALLRPSSDRLMVELTPLPDAAHLYPLTVQVEVDGVVLGEVSVPEPGEPNIKAVSYPLPERADPRAPVEVRLIPEHWVLHKYEEKSYVASCYLNVLGFTGD